MNVPRRTFVRIDALERGLLQIWSRILLQNGELNRRTDKSCTYRRQQ